MTIREYKPDDCKEITELFFNTVHTVNAKDYSKEQLDVWAPEIPDFEKWKNPINNKKANRTAKFQMKSDGPVLFYVPTQSRTGD